MHVFTIETTFRLPVYRQSLYLASTLDRACCLAINDNDRRFVRRDHANIGPVYVSGAWAGPHMGYPGPALHVPPQYDDVVNRKADHFDTLLAVLKQSASPDDAVAQAAIAKAQAILATNPAR